MHLNKEPDLNDLRKKHQISLLIYGAMVGSVFCYGLVAFIMRDHFTPSVSFGHKTSAIFKSVLLVLSVVELGFAWPLRNWILPKEIKVSAGETTALSSPASRLLTSSIVTHALCEVVAIYGLALFMMTRDISDFYLFGLISLTGFAIYLPRFSQWEKYIEATLR